LGEGKTFTLLYATHTFLLCYFGIHAFFQYVPEAPEFSRIVVTGHNPQKNSERSLSSIIERTVWVFLPKKTNEKVLNNNEQLPHQV